MKFTLYPKTQRVAPDSNKVVLTEKLDGSNLGLFVKGGELCIAQRNHIFGLDELEKVKGSLYKGLYAYLKKYGKELEETMYPDSVVFGEWLGTGRIKYPEVGDSLERWYTFAKGRVDDDYNVARLDYDLANLCYSFGGELPDCVCKVPVIVTLDYIPDISELDAIYQRYSEEVGRQVEGIIVLANNAPLKYVRRKNGKETPHTYRGD